MMKKKFLYPFLIIFYFCSICLSQSETDDEIRNFFRVTSSSLFLREKPNTNSNILTKLKNNRIVKLIERTNIESTIDGIIAFWFKVKTEDNKVGYVFSGYLNIVEYQDDFQCSKDPLESYCGNSEKFLDCSKIIESKLIDKYPKKIKRNDKSIILILKNKNQLKYTDQIYEDEVKNCFYTLWNYYNDIGYFLIAEHHYEGGKYIFINEISGHQIIIWKIPLVISPNKQKICISSCTEAYDPNGIQIVNISSKKPYIEYEKEFDWLPGPAIWVNESTLKILKNEKFHNKYVISEIILIKKGRTWEITY